MVTGRQLSGLIFFGLWIFFQQTPGLGQNSVLDQKIEFSCTDCPVAEALSQIEPKISYYFSYNPDLFTGTKPVTATFEKISVRDLLDSIIRDTTVLYSVIEKQIVLYRLTGKDINGLKQSKNRKSRQIIVSGTVMDQNSQKPIPFASICIVGKSLGSVTNMQGEFIIKIPGYLWQDSLGISCIGYKTLIKPLIKVENQDRFELQTDYIPIQEVIIRKTDPIYLIRSALKKIPENYDMNPAMLTSFYRETIERGSKYLSVTESVLQTYKTGYGQNIGTDQIKVLKGRKSQNVNSGDSLLVKLKAGLNTTILLDVVKNPADFLQEEFFNYYNYHLADIISDNDRETYVIDFKQKENVTEPLYYGKIYIDVNSLAITNFEFSLSKNGIEKTGNRFIVKKPHWLIVKPVEANYRVNYREYGQKYYLNFMRCEAGFKMRRRKQLFSSLYNSKIEMVITDIDTMDVKRFKYKEITKPETIFTDLINEKPETFWENYNYIKPEESLEHAVDRINVIIKNN